MKHVLSLFLFKQKLYLKVISCKTILITITIRMCIKKLYYDNSEITNSMIHFKKLTLNESCRGAGLETMFSRNAARG